VAVSCSALARPSKRRSEIMRAVPRTRTAPEQRVTALLRTLGYRYRTNRKNLPGSPDIVLRDASVAIFVHGCFWHRHECRAGRSTPTSNQQFWLRKFRENRSRDRRQCKALREMGYRVVVSWECQTKASARSSLTNRLTRLLGRVGLSTRGQTVRASS
jgi:DNA mismatch endonuclease (patch repair protein)